MDNTILPSTLLLTLLLIVGQVFFIRASTKDRIEKAQLISTQEEAILLPRLKEYFQSRFYRVAEVDPKQNQVTFEGFVRPSFFFGSVFNAASICRNSFSCFGFVATFPKLWFYFLRVATSVSFERIILLEKSRKT
jgi:Cofactor assembly of complex C subunit B